MPALEPLLALRLVCQGWPVAGATPLDNTGAAVLRALETLLDGGRRVAAALHGAPGSVLSTASGRLGIRSELVRMQDSRLRPRRV